MSISHFKQLEVWQHAMGLTKLVYELTASFPREERYGLVSQMQRSAVSIPSNIAEGNARASTRDYARFVSMALGSAAELQTQLLLSKELSMGDDMIRDSALQLCDRIGQMLLRLRQALNHRLESEPQTAHAESRVPSPESRTSESSEEYL